MFLLGSPDSGLTVAREAISHAEGLEQAYSVAYAQVWAALIRFLRREPGLSAEHARYAMNLSQKHGFVQHLAYAKAHLGRALIDLGEIDEGVSLVRSGLSDGTGMGIGFNRTLNLATLAVGAAKEQDWDEAMERLDEALTQVDASGERWYEAEIYRFKGEFLLEQRGTAAAPQAEACLHRSLEIARRQGARAWELRTATSLARLWQSQGKSTAASALLVPVHGVFTEGNDTTDLKEAKALLDRLSEGGGAGITARHF